MILARPYCCTENIRIHAVVIPELELINVKRKILARYLMERTHDAALHDRPESFDGVGMNCAMHVLPLTMTDNAMWVSVPEVCIASMLVCRDQANPIGYRIANERIQSLFGGVFNHTRNDITLAPYSADDDVLLRAACTAKVSASAFPFVLVFGFAPNKGFIHFHIADELLELDIAQGSTNLVAHQQGGIVGTEAHVTHDLQRANAFLAGEHQVHHTEPVAQGFVGVLEDRTDQHGEAVADVIRRAFVAIPMKWLGSIYMSLCTATRAAYYAVRPTVSGKIFLASIFMRKLFLKLANTHLVNLHLLLSSGIHVASCECGDIRT
jgi:hypothetical protein